MADDKLAAQKIYRALMSLMTLPDSKKLIQYNKDWNILYTYYNHKPKSLIGIPKPGKSKLLLLFNLKEGIVTTSHSFWKETIE